VYIRFSGGKGGTLSGSFIPHSLEYSPKDDKFRLITAGGSRHATINLARISLCELRGTFSECDVLPPSKHMVPLTLELLDERNALERVLLHFSNYRKETERIGDSLYRMTLWYDSDDETEILIRILSFGPMIRVTSPDSFIRQIKEGSINR
jgi:predicted DNA-binding transcriptional regulator YafY